MTEIELSGIASDLVKNFSQPILNGIRKTGKEYSDKLKVNFNLCFTNYIERTYDRYSKTKTLLYRDAPVKIKEFYVRTDLSLGHEDIKELEFMKHVTINKRIIITGTAGSGKSTFCKSIFLDTVEKSKDIFPIFIELRHLNSNEEIDIYDHIATSLSSIDLSFSKQQLDHALNLGKILLIFDGFDEIHSDKREDIEKSIINLSGKHQNIMIIISSRPDARFSSWDEFYLYKMLPLDKEKALNLIEKLEYDAEVKEKFLANLNENLFDKHRSFAQTPLLLTMMLLTYEQISEIPNKIHLFYEQAFLTLFNKHDSLKSLYKRRSFSGLPLDDFKHVTAAFSILSYSDRKYNFSSEEITYYLRKSIALCDLEIAPDQLLNDFLDSVCIIQRDGLGYSFTHRSFQEYFSALFLVRFVSTNKYEIFDKIAFINDRDDVIPMVYDINRDLLEREWVIPRLKIFVDDLSKFPETQDGKIQALGLLYSGLMVHTEDGEEKSIALRMHNRRDDHANFIFLLRKIYAENFRSLHKSHYKKLSKKSTDHEFIRLDIERTKEQFIDLKDASGMKKASRNRLLKTSAFNFVLCNIETAKEILLSLEDLHNNKQKNFASLLLKS